MGLLSGSLSVSRFHLSGVPDFEAAPFQEIPAGAEEIRRSLGFVPMLPGEPYEIGAKRWAGRVRVDELKPDPQVVKDRFDELVSAELEAGAFALSKKRRRDLKELAWLESAMGTTPARRYVDFAVGGELAYIASTSRADLGEVMMLFRRVGATLSPATPWEELPEMQHAFLESQPGQSAWGPRFLGALLEANGKGAEKEVALNVLDGRASLIASEARIGLSGDIGGKLMHQVIGGAEIVSAKLVTDKALFTLDALSWWIKSAKLGDVEAGHWTETLDARFEQIGDLFEVLDSAFHRLRRAVEGGATDGRAWIQDPLPGARLKNSPPVKISGQESAAGRVLTFLDTPEGRRQVEKTMGPGATVGRDDDGTLTIGVDLGRARAAP